MTTKKAHCKETRLRNAFSRFVEEHGSDKAIAVIQRVLAENAAPITNHARSVQSRP